jgi:competence protein ComEC
MNIIWLINLLLLLTPLTPLPVKETQAPTPSRLAIYYIDVEGGAATLIVTPARESVLIDAGWPGNDGRDAKRIEAAMKKAGIQAIDHLIITHYHTDHFGGVPELAARVKINQFYDHGPMSNLSEDPNFDQKYKAYLAATKGKSITLDQSEAGGGNPTSQPAGPFSAWGGPE